MAMELTTWFGQIDLENGNFVPAGDRDQMTDKLIELSAAQVTGEGLPEAKQPDLRVLAKACGFVSSDAEYTNLLRDVALGLVKRKLKSLATVESNVLQMIEALDDLDQTANLLDERLYEWSLLHRDDLARDKDLAKALTGRGPMGDLATAIMNLKASRQQIEEALSQSIQTIAPNLSSLAGPLLAARLMSRAGSLERLSQMPSSAIQLIGAEKSLFKHLKGKAPSPKHGLIYRHPAILKAPKKQRGRLARALSGKLAIAARIDYHSGVIWPELKETLDNRLSEIRRSGKRTDAPKPKV
jgi:nucleolar protein 56